MEFKAGDVVRMKSGGPVMTIRWIGAVESQQIFVAYCHWFVDSAHMAQGIFDTNVIEKFQQGDLSLAK